MASIYKKKADGPYVIAYHPKPNLRKTVTGFMSLKDTQVLAGKLEAEARRCRKGLVDERAERIAASEARFLLEHVKDFEQALRDRGDVPGHAERTGRMVRCIVQGTKATKWAHLSQSGIDGWLADLQRANLGPLQANGKRPRAFGPSTRNHYVRAVKSFCNWMIRDGRASYNPLAGLSTVNADVDVRVKRRVLSLKDLQALLTKTATEPERYGLTGPQRVLVYRLALATGLRAGEIASLTVADFRLADGVVEVQAAYAKNRRRDELPLRADLLADLGACLRGRDSTEQAIPAMPDSDRTAEMLKADLEAAGLVYDAPEGRYDFHSLRHQFCSDLVASGANVKVAQALARHSTPVLTIGRYSHVRVHDRQAAVEALPDLATPQPSNEAQKATGTADAVAVQVAEREAAWRQKSAENGNTRHIRIASTGDDHCTAEVSQNGEKQPIRLNTAQAGNQRQRQRKGGGKVAVGDDDPILSPQRLPFRHYPC
jgi:integrase